MGRIMMGNRKAVPRREQRLVRILPLGGVAHTSGRLTHTTSKAIFYDAIKCKRIGRKNFKSF